MKSITLTVDDDVYEAVATKANKHQTSVSALVEGYLRTLGQGGTPLRPDWNEEEERKNREELVRLLSECKLELGYKPSREKTYEGGRFSRF
jgi:hypothetical protein